MNRLSRYLEPIKVAGESLDDKFEAYRMDNHVGDNQMRKNVGLGTCSCCDYFTLNNHSIFLIEKTNLTKTIRNYKAEFDYLQDHQKIIKIISKLIKQENWMKVYGSMLVICRLTLKCNQLKDLLKNKSYTFLLVSSGDDKLEDHIFYEYLVSFISNELKSQLSRELVKDVKIVPSDMFNQFLSKNEL